MKISAYTVTCEGAPLQIEGTLDNGQSFYFRARHHAMRIEVNDAVLFTVMSNVPDDPHIFSAAIDHEWAVQFIDGLLGMMRA